MEPICKRSSNVKFQPGPQKNVRSAAAVMDEELLFSLLCLERLKKKGLPLSRRVTGNVTAAAHGACFYVAWVEVWRQLEQESAGRDKQS